MKNYMLFAGDTYYPNPGMGDFVDSFDDLEDAIGVASRTSCDWWQIYSIEDNNIVAEMYN